MLNYNAFCTPEIYIINKSKGKRGNQAPTVYRNKNHKQENEMKYSREKEETILLFPGNQDIKKCTPAATQSSLPCPQAPGWEAPS